MAMADAVAEQVPVVAGSGGHDGDRVGRKPHDGSRGCATQVPCSQYTARDE